MKRKFYTTAALALAVGAAAALLGACKATDTAGNTSAASKAREKTSGTTEVNADGVRRVGPAELQQMVESGGVVIYDTRSKASYEQEHIKGSLSMPSDEVAARMGELPRGKTLVFYCT